MFASLVQGPLLRLFSVGLVVLGLQRTLFADLRPGRRRRCRSCWPWPPRPAPPAARRRAPSPASCSALMYDLAVGTPLGSSSIAMGLGGYVAGYVTSITIDPQWWLAALFTGLGAAVGEAGRARDPGVHRRGARVRPALRYRRGRRRGGRDGAQPAARPGRPLVHAHQASGVEGAEGTMMTDRRARHRRDTPAKLVRWLLTSAPRASASWPSSPTLLFGAVGARLWFLQTVQAESLQQTVDARKTEDRPARARAGPHLRRRRPDPRRQRAGADGQRRLGRDPARTPTAPSCSPGCRAGWRCRSRRWRPATTPSCTAATCRCR